MLTTAQSKKNNHSVSNTAIIGLSPYYGGMEMDALQMALSSTVTVTDPQEHLNKLTEGIELTLKQFTTSLEKHGVTMVSHDEPFDPNIHNAVQSIDSEDVESGQIVQTFQTGYKYKNRPLREAMVVVAN